MPRPALVGIKTDQRGLTGVVEIEQIAVELEVPVASDLDGGVGRLLR